MSQVSTAVNHRTSTYQDHASTQRTAMHFVGSWAYVAVLLHLLASVSAELELDGLSEPMSTGDQLGASAVGDSSLEVRQTRRCQNPGWGTCPSEQKQNLSHWLTSTQQ
jgi:hypothetical protein